MSACTLSRTSSAPAGAAASCFPASPRLYSLLDFACKEESAEAAVSEAEEAGKCEDVQRLLERAVERLQLWPQDGPQSPRQHADAGSVEACRVFSAECGDSVSLRPLSWRRSCSTASTASSSSSSSGSQSPSGDGGGRSGWLSRESSSDALWLQAAGSSPLAAAPIAGSALEELQSLSLAELEADDSSRLQSVVQVGEAEVEGATHALLAAHLSYPQHWKPAVSISPFHSEDEEQAEREVLSWMQAALGQQVMTARLQQAVLAIAPARWAALLCPLAPDDYRALLARFLALGLLVDDCLIERTAQTGLGRQQLAPLAELWRLAASRRTKAGRQATAAMVQQLQVVADASRVALLPHLARGLVELSDAYVALGADAVWCGRMAAAWLEYVELGCREAATAAAITAASSSSDPSAPLPGLAVPLGAYDSAAVHAHAAANSGRVSGVALLQVLARQRLSSIGLPLIALQLERASGLSLSAAVDALLRPSTDSLSLAAAMVNELVGLGRDLRDGSDGIGANFTLVQQRVCRTSLQAAVGFTLDLHDSAVRAFDLQAASVLQQPAVAATAGLRPRLAVHLDRLRHLARGYAHWHEGAARYRTTLASDRALRQLFVFPLQDGDEGEHRQAALDHCLLQYRQLADAKQRLKAKVQQPQP